MSTPLASIPYKNNQAASPINSVFSSSSLPQGTSFPLPDLRPLAISSVQKKRLHSLVKTCGFDDAFIQAVPEEALQSDQHLTSYLFSVILNEMTRDAWDALVYDQLLELYDLQGMNLAFAAVREGKNAFFSYLIDHVPVNDLIKLKGSEEREELKGKTLLHLIAIYGREEMLEDLLHGKSGIVGIKDQDALGLTALHWAIHEGHEGILQKLLSYGITGQEWRSGKKMISLIAIAIASGYPNILAILLKHNQFKEISLLDSLPHVKTVLHLAIHLNQPRMLEYLLNHEHGSITHLLELKDRSERTPLQLAAFLGDLFAIKALITKAAHIHKGEFEKFGTALHFAVKGKQPDVLTLLLSLGADPNKTDEAGKAPLAYLQGRESEHVIMKRCKNIIENFTASKRLEKIKEVDFHERAPFNLILEGSYHQKEAFIGIIQGIESKKILKDIRRFSGQGMGAVVATLLALGYTSSQIKELSFNSLQDLFNIDSSLTDVHFKELEDLYLPLSSEKKRLDSSIALCKIEELQSRLEEAINHQVEIENLSFKELAEKIKRYPEKYRHIHLTAYSLTKGKIIHFSSENPEYRDFLLSDVLAATVTFPGIFKPLTLRRKNSDGDLYDDTTYGKMIASSEISLVDQFDDLIYQEDPYYKGKQTNYRTLALKVDHQEGKKDAVLEEPPLVHRLIHFYMNQAQQKNLSDEISRGRIKSISFLEEDNDHTAAAKKQIESLFSSAKKSGIAEKNLLSIQLESKNNLIPWKYDIFLKGSSLSNESTLLKQSSFINNVPKQDIFFTGRVKELDDLKTTFATSSKVAVAGLGGIGKSTLSFKYAAELGGYKFIYLIRATASGAIRTALIELAGLLNIKKEKSEETLADLRVHLQQMTLPGLFIIDGLDEEHFFKELQSYIPERSLCQILISTRVGDKAKVNGFKVIPLIEFSEEEAIRYLTRIDQPAQEEQKAAASLAKAVGYHPLALSHIARYLEQEQISLCEYKRRFKTRDPKLPGKDDIDLPTEEASIFVTWQISLDAIKEKEKGFLAIEMMQMIALLGEEDIPLDLLYTWARSSYPQEDEVSISGAIKLLKGYSFFREIIDECDQNKYYQVHSLVQKVMAFSLEEKKEKDDFFKKTCTTINQTIKQIREPSYAKNSYFDQRLEILYRAHLSRLYEMSSLFEALENHHKIQFLSHLGWAYSRYVSPLNIAHQYIDHGIALLDQNSLELLKNDDIHLLDDSDINPLTKEKNLMMAELYQIKSRCIRYTESTEEAIALAEKALMIRKRLLNQDNPHLLESYDAVIWLLHDREAFEKELPFVREALKIKAKNLGENHNETLKNRNRIVAILYDIAENQDENEEALSHAKIVLESRKEILKNKADGDVDELFKSYDTVIRILIGLENYQEALDYANTALELKVDILGNNSNETLDVYETVIEILLRLENYQEAFFPAQQELKNRIRFITEPDDETTSSYDRFIELLKDLTLNENMISLLQELVDQLGSSFGEDHPMTINLYNETVKLILKTKNEEYFLCFTKHRLDKQRKQLGETHSKTLNNYQKILKFLCDSKKEMEALSFAQSMVENKHITLEKTHEKKLKSYDIVIETINDLIPHTESSPIYAQEKFQIYEKIMKALKNSQQKDDEIFKLQQKLYTAQNQLESNRKTLGEGNYQTFETYTLVIDLLKSLGQKEEAIATAQKMLDASIKTLGEGNYQTSLSYIFVINLFKELKQKEKAIAIAQNMLETNKKILGEGDALIFENYKVVIDLFKDLGQKEKAIATAQNMLETNKKILGEGNHRTSLSYTLLINLFKELRQKEKAIATAQTQLDASITTFGETDHQTSDCYKRVIDLFKEFGLKEDALITAHKQLDASIKILGETDFRTFNRYKLVIDLLKDLGQKEDALAAAQKQLDASIKTFEETDSRIFNSYKLVIDLLKDLGRKEDALATAHKQLDASIKTFGETASQTFNSYKLVIGLLKDLGRKEDALAAAHKQLDASIKTLGETDYQTSESYKIVIDLLKGFGEKEDALATAQKQLDANIKAFGNTGYKIAESYKIVIDLFKDLGQKENALTTAQKQLDANIKAFGDTDYKTAESYKIVIDLLKGFGEKEDALATAQKQLDANIKAFGDTDYKTAESYKIVIDLFKDLGQKENALATAQKQLDINIKAFGDTDYKTAESYKIVIDLFKDLGQKEDALITAQKQLNERIKKFGEIDYRTSECYKLVIDLLKSLGQKEHALAIAQKQLDARIKQFGETDYRTAESYEIVNALLKECGREEEILTSNQ